MWYSPLLGARGFRGRYTDRGLPTQKQICLKKSTSSLFYYGASFFSFPVQLSLPPYKCLCGTSSLCMITNKDLCKVSLYFEINIWIIFCISLHLSNVSYEDSWAIIMCKHHSPFIIHSAFSIKPLIIDDIRKKKKSWFDLFSCILAGLLVQGQTDTTDIQK